jgi:glycine cleavage system transcriptional repressor
VDERRLIAVAVMGPDRPGIVVGVTRVLFEHRCNLEDVSCTILRSHFAMMLLVGSSEVDAPQLEDALRPVAERLGLVITAHPVDPRAVDIPAPTHTVSVYGTDRSGIVYRVAETLADEGVQNVHQDARG